MLNASFGEFFLFILRFIKSDDECDSHLFENGDIVVWGEGAVLISHVEWARERDELAWNSPVQVTILNFLVVLVLNNVEGLVVVPSELDAQMETIEAVLNSALVCTCSHGSVSKGRKFVMVWGEHFPGLGSRFVEDDYHECSHQECGVGLLCIVKTGVVIDLVS